MSRIATLVTWLLLLCSSSLFAAERLLVRFHDPESQYKVQLEKVVLLSPQKSARGMAIFELDSSLNSAQRDLIFKNLTNSPFVKWAEWDHPVNGPKATGGSPLSSSQVDWQKMINLPDAWQYQTDCTKVIVAIIDSGVDVNHPDLKNNIWINSSEVLNGGIDTDGNGYKEDYNGWNAISNNGDVRDIYAHGTHVAGIIGAGGSSGSGGLGACWKANLLPLKFLDSFGDGQMSDAVRAIYYVLDMQENLPNYRYIINNSWASPASFALKQAIADATAAGVLVVNAAGNAGMDDDQADEYPAVIAGTNPSLITVANFNNLLSTVGALDPTSNWGLHTVTLAAPGRNILSTLPMGKSSVPVYGMDSGTSMSSAVVSGVAALLWSYRPALTAPQIRALLEAYVKPISTLNGVIKAPGTLDAFQAITRSDTLPPMLVSIENSGGQTYIRGANLDRVTALYISNKQSVDFDKLTKDYLKVKSLEALTCGYLTADVNSYQYFGLYLDLTPSPPTSLSFSWNANGVGILSWSASLGVNEFIIEKSVGVGQFGEWNRVASDLQTFSQPDFLTDSRLRVKTMTFCSVNDLTVPVARYSIASAEVLVAGIATKQGTSGSAGGGGGCTVGDPENPDSSLLILFILASGVFILRNSRFTNGG